MTAKEFKECRDEWGLTPSQMNRFIYLGSVSRVFEFEGGKRKIPPHVEQNINLMTELALYAPDKFQEKIEAAKK